MYEVNFTPAFNDNYIWFITHHGNTVVVDPGCADSVNDYLNTHNLTLCGILVTHHHKDHTGGVDSLKKQFPEIPVYGPKNSPFKGITNSLKQGDKVELPWVNAEFTIWETPGHTLDHICYIDDQSAFVGDTLFASGCGRLFEGDAQQMHASLLPFLDLDPSIQMYCGHEYTLANVRFANTVEPDNLIIADYLEVVERHTEKGMATLPTTLQTEFDTNPFLRFREPSLVKSVECWYGDSLSDEAIIFEQTRAWKDQLDASGVLE